jgi:hypothetical protein
MLCGRECCATKLRIAADTVGMLHIVGNAVDDIVFSIHADEDYSYNYENAKD